MAVYGIGANWGSEDKTNDFINGNEITIGWKQKDAEDLCNLLLSFKMGDIVFLKSNAPGSPVISVKGIGIVTHGVLTSNGMKKYGSPCSVDVLWKSTTNFSISIPSNSGKLTNIRAATIYEEYHPHVVR